MKSIILATMIALTGCATESVNGTDYKQETEYKKELIGDWIAVINPFTIYIYNQDETYVYVQGIETPMYYHVKGESLFIYRNKNMSDILEFVRY